LDAGRDLGESLADSFCRDDARETDPRFEKAANKSEKWPGRLEGRNDADLCGLAEEHPRVRCESVSVTEEAERRGRSKRRFIGQRIGARRSQNNVQSVRLVESEIDREDTEQKRRGGDWWSANQSVQ